MHQQLHHHHMIGFPMKHVIVRLVSLLCAAVATLALQSPAQAQAVPEITPSLKKMLSALPIADMKDDVQKMVGTLKNTKCGGNLTGCYATKSGALQLYFFTSQNTQQTFLLVINKKMAMPKLLKDNVQKVLGGTSLSDPIISISTTDIDLDITQMPADLQQIVRNSYFNVNALSFSSGVQLAARADLGGLMKATFQSFGVNLYKYLSTSQLTYAVWVNFLIKKARIQYFFKHQIKKSSSGNQSMEGELTSININLSASRGKLISVVI